MMGETHKHDRGQGETIYDISPLIYPGMPVWPGDTPPEREVLMDLARGDSVTLSTLRSTVHVGAHADAPSHVDDRGASIDDCRLGDYLGRCQMLRVTVECGTRVMPRDIRTTIEAERVLIATGTYPDANRFDTDFAALAPELVAFLRDRGVRLVGIDTPSVDLFDSHDLPTHHACRKCGVAILEGLVLNDVPEGLYELIALPLRLVGFDASPVRAVLRTIDRPRPAPSNSGGV
jgi:arylformamidase